MKKYTDKDWEDKIEDLLKKINIKGVDFTRTQHAMSYIHKDLIELISKEWNKHNPVVEQNSFQIDFVGRNFANFGKIQLATEIDTLHKPIKNWAKLLDINSAAKIWIYLCSDKSKANDRFKEAVKGFRNLAKLRQENNSNNVTFFMKTLGQSDVKKDYLFK